MLVKFAAASGADGQGRLEVELELHADAGVNLGVVATADVLVHLRAVLYDELGAKADAQVVLLDAGKGAHAVVTVHGNLFVNIAQGDVVLAPFLRLAVYAEADAVLASALPPGNPATGLLPLRRGWCRRGLSAESEHAIYLDEDVGCGICAYSAMAVLLIGMD